MRTCLLTQTLIAGILGFGNFHATCLPSRWYDINPSEEPAASQVLQQSSSTQSLEHHAPSAPLLQYGSPGIGTNEPSHQISDTTTRERAVQFSSQPHGTETPVKTIPQNFPPRTPSDLRHGVPSDIPQNFPPRTDSDLRHAVPSDGVSSFQRGYSLPGDRNPQTNSVDGTQGLNAIDTATRRFQHEALDQAYRRGLRRKNAASQHAAWAYPAGERVGWAYPVWQHPAWQRAIWENAVTEFAFREQVAREHALREHAAREYAAWEYAARVYASRHYAALQSQAGMRGPY